MSPDVHGNAEDFERMHEIFRRELDSDSATYWVMLGDIVHGPNSEARQRRPDLYDYDDASWEIAEAVEELVDELPDRVFFVLGNHEYAHVGGPHTHKFHPDEVEHLEEKLESEQIERLHDLFRSALLCVLSPCGAFFCHGSPDIDLESLDELDRIEFPPSSSREEEILESFLMTYGQTGEICDRFLSRISELGDMEQRFLIHGHDRDEDGYFLEGGNQLVPVFFGAPRENRRYVRLDLRESYRSIGQLREGREILRLYPEDGESR